MSISSHALDRALARHGSEMNSEEFLVILAEAADSTDTLTQGEHQLLVEHGGVSPAAADPDRQAEARRRIAVASAEADAAVLQNGYTTSEVAERLHVAPANVRRMLARGDLFVAGRTRAREHIFPTWQFAEDGPLPGLREVLETLPGDYHPLDVAEFMTAPNEALGGRSPAGWLAHGGDPARVVHVADELGRA